MTVLTEKAIEQALADLPGWSRRDNALYRRLVFRNFIEAFGFMSQVALLAERACHHPDWRNSYKTVELWLSTHEAGGITGKDLALAAAISAIVD